jgi:hypothetical protein
MRKAVTLSSVAVSLALPFAWAACGQRSEPPNQPLPPSAPPIVQSDPQALKSGSSAPSSTTCAFPLPANLADLVGPIGETYLQTAFDNTNACAIDEYFFPDFEKDGLNDYLTNQLTPWLLRFFGCPNPGHEVIGKHEGFSAIGLVPAHDPPFTITATDYYMIVTEFLKAVSDPFTSGPGVGECIFGFTQEEIARINVKLYELAPLVINDFANVGLTHSDPLGPGTCPAYDTPVDVRAACVGTADAGTP